MFKSLVRSVSYIKRLTTRPVPVTYVNGVNVFSSFTIAILSDSTLEFPVLPPVELPPAHPTKDRAVPLANATVVINVANFFFYRTGIDN